MVVDPGFVVDPGYWGPPYPHSARTGTQRPHMPVRNLPGVCEVWPWPELAGARAACDQRLMVASTVRTITSASTHHCAVAGCQLWWPGGGCAGRGHRAHGGPGP